MDFTEELGKKLSDFKAKYDKEPSKMEISANFVKDIILSSGSLAYYINFNKPFIWGGMEVTIVKNQNDLIYLI